MTQVPRQLVVVGADGLPRDAARSPCKKLVLTTDAGNCCTTNPGTGCCSVGGLGFVNPSAPNGGLTATVSIAASWMFERFDMDAGGVSILRTDASFGAMGILDPGSPVGAVGSCSANVRFKGTGRRTDTTQSGTSVSTWDVLAVGDWARGVGVRPPTLGQRIVVDGGPLAVASNELSEMRLQCSLLVGGPRAVVRFGSGRAWLYGTAQVDRLPGGSITGFGEFTTVETGSVIATPSCNGAATGLRVQYRVDYPRQPGLPTVPSYQFQIVQSLQVDMSFRWGGMCGCAAPVVGGGTGGAGGCSGCGGDGGL